MSYYAYMKTGDELKKAIRDWAQRIGEGEARARMFNAGVGYSTIMLILTGKYHSEPKARLVTILNSLLAKQSNKAS